MTSPLFRQRLFELLSIAAQLTELDLPILFVTEALSVALQRTYRALQSDEHVGRWAAIMLKQLHTLAVGDQNDVSLELLAEKTFAELYAAPSGKLFPLTFMNPLELSLRVGDARSAAVCARVGTEQLQVCGIGRRARPTLRNRSRVLDEDGQFRAHDIALREWREQFQMPIDVRFDARFENASLTTRRLRLLAANCQASSVTLLRLIGEWRAKLDQPQFWNLQRQRWRARTTDNPIAIFTSHDVMLDARLRMIVLAVKFAAQLCLLDLKTHPQRAGTELLVPFFDIARGVTLLWAVACYERLYRVLVLHVQARGAYTTPHGQEIFEGVVQKLALLAANAQHSGGSEWSQKAFLEDFLIGFETVARVVPLEPADRQALLCTVRTTYKSLRVLDRFFAQMASIFSVTCDSTDMPAIREFASSGVVAQQRATRQIATQTVQLAKLIALLVA